MRQICINLVQIFKMKSLLLLAVLAVVATVGWAHSLATRDVLYAEWEEFKSRHGKVSFDHE